MKESNKKIVKKTVLENRTNKKDTVPSAKAMPETKSPPDISNDTEPKNTAPFAIPAVMTEQERKGQGKISGFSEVIEESVEIVRGDFLADWRKPKVTIGVKTITFNMACVNVFQNCQHITISIDKKKRRLFIQPTKEYDDTNLKFANFKNGRNVPRISTTKYFCPYLFDFMKWDPEAKYRILMIYQVFGDKQVMIFNLDDAQEVFSEVIEAAGDDKKKRKTTVYLPDGWQGRFGYRNDELAEKRRLDFNNEVVTFNDKTGKGRDIIEPQPPTPENLMHEQYGGIRKRKETKNDD
jgi:hypothetical protein